MPPADPMILPTRPPARGPAWPAGVGVVILLAAACSGNGGGGGIASSLPPPPGLEYVPPAPGTYELPPIQPAADGTVIDADGTRRRLHDYLGDRLALLSFVYTKCSDVEGCLLATGVLQMVARELGNEPELADRVRLITLSFDPEHDTPSVMRRYAARDYEDTRWDRRTRVFLTTASREAIRPILEGYGQYVVPEFDEEENPTGDYSHVLKVYLIDRDMQVRNIYSTSFLHPAIAINDLKTLAMREYGGSG